MGLSLGRHPLALLRSDLQRQGFVTAEDLREMPADDPVRIAGLVITRQRPGSAGGVIFVTLEDETGHVNLIVWPQLAERQRRVLLGSRLLAVRGRIQRQGDVLHVIVSTAEDRSAALGALACAQPGLCLMSAFRRLAAIEHLEILEVLDFPGNAPAFKEVLEFAAC